MIISTRAVILKRYKIGEADRLLLTFTEDFGKLLVVAKSVRRLQSKLAGHIELFEPTLLELVRGKGDYFKLTGAQGIDPYHRTSFNIHNLRHLDILAETIDLALGEEQENKRAFLTFVDGIRLIKKYPDNSYLISIETLVKLLDAIGFKPELNICTICNQNIRDKDNGWLSSSGGIICHDCKDNHPDINPVLDNKTISLLRLMQSKEMVANRLKADRRYIEEANQFIVDYLFTHLPRPLKAITSLNYE